MGGSTIHLIFPLQACHKNIPILVDAERKREGLDDLLKLASYVVCSANFPQASLLFDELAYILDSLCQALFEICNLVFKPIIHPLPPFQRKIIEDKKIKNLPRH